LIEKLNISNDFYIRTTDKKVHYPTAQAIWKKLVEKGDIYKKKYSGLYCYGCEKFVTGKDLEDGKCPLHDRKPEKVEEENYFFKLSNYSDKLKELIESDNYHIIPKGRKKEILNFLKKGLEDVSFSRSVKSLEWGVPVPEDDEQVMYVWCDALTNYLSGIGFSNDQKKFRQYWPADVHLIGKDILRFHALFWPAMLISAGIKTPKKLLVHGFITSEGKKMSKSLGNVIDPFKEIEKYGPDALRYYLLREIPADDDGDYSDKLIIAKINGNLVGDFGNLVNRVLTLVAKFNNSKIPKGKKISDKINFKDYQKFIDEFNFQGYIDESWKLIQEANKEINDKEPWKLDGKKRDELLYELLEKIRISSILLYPIMPDASVKILEKLGLGEEHVSVKNLKYNILKSGNEVEKGDLLFKKIEVK